MTKRTSRRRRRAAPGGRNWEASIFDSKLVGGCVRPPERLIGGQGEAPPCALQRFGASCCSSVRSAIAWFHVRPPARLAGNSARGCSGETARPAASASAAARRFEWERETR